MYIYNVTVTIDESIHKEWRSWIEVHIQEVLATNKFTKAKLTKILAASQMESISYSIQYTAQSKEKLDEYYKVEAPKLRENSLNKFSDKMHSFRTELKVIKEFYP